MDTTTIILTIVGACLGSQGLFAFLQYLFSRKDKKNDKIDIVQKSIDELKKTVDVIKAEMENMRKNFKSDIDDVIDKIDRNQAIEARIRILRANDEMRQDVHHSYEYFKQLHSDITEYEKYCSKHPDFKNNEAINSIEYINRVYQECLNSNNFLV